MTAPIVEAELVNWFKKKLADETGLTFNEIDLDTSIDSLKLDSLSLVTIAYELEEFLKISIDPTIFTEFKTFNEIIEWITRKQA